MMEGGCSWDSRENAQFLMLPTVCLGSLCFTKLEYIKYKRKGLDQTTCKDFLNPGDLGFEDTGN